MMIPIRELFKKIKFQQKAGHPFVVYRKPNEKTVRLVTQATNELKELHEYSESGFVFAPFSTERKPIIIPFDNVFEAPFDIDPERYMQDDFEIGTKQEDKAFHLELVSKGIEQINEGKLKKVVLSRVLSVPIDLDIPRVLSKLLDNYPTAFCYLWFHPSAGMWIGASPETLLQINRLTQTRFKTMSLAGTQPYFGTLNVSWGEKEKEEQQLVTDTLVQGLTEIGITNPRVSDQNTHRAGNLLHLKTEIEGVIENESRIKELVATFHPTPAVCGLPKLDAKEFIASNEGYDREFYTGFLGELNLKTKVERSSRMRNVENRAYSAVSKSTSLFVNLRCMKLEKTKANIYVGGGVTKDSVAEKEWKETVSKAATMLRILG